MQGEKAGFMNAQPPASNLPNRRVGFCSGCSVLIALGRDADEAFPSGGEPQKMNGRGKNIRKRRETRIDGRTSRRKRTLETSIYKNRRDQTTKRGSECFGEGAVQYRR